jgi:hypothetical protein
LSPPSLTAGLTVTLDQLVALNDEMAALARAGVPLDQGLLHWAGGWRRAKRSNRF